MKTMEFERILKSEGFELVRLSSHRIWSKGAERVALPHDKQVNRMIARRILKTIGYKGSVPELNYKGAPHENL